MEIFTAIARNSGSIFSLVGPQFGYLTSYKSNLEKLRTQVQNLTADRTDMQRTVDDALKNGDDIAVGVQRWLDRVEITIADANKLITEDNDGHGEVRCLNWPFPNLCVRFKLSMEAKVMAQKVSEIIDEGKSFRRVSFPVRPQTTTSSWARGYEALESRTSTLNGIKQALKDPNIYRIGVYGMPGVGKTTLVNELAWQVEREGSFGVVVTATITNTPNLRRIQGQLAAGLGLKLETEAEEGRAGELRRRISNEKSILIILDDIWNELKLEELGVPYDADHKRCKLVLTSRDLSVLSGKMGTEKNFSLQTFSEGESWKLFEKIVGDVVKHSTINSIAVDVVKCCAGLPLLIDIVAKDLRKKPDILVWKDTLTRLQSNSGDYNVKVNRTLRLSYERLEREELRSLFLLIGSFGQVGIGIYTEELLQVCWGLGIYKDVSTLAQARDRQHALIEDLRASSLLLDGESIWVRMHDLVHEVAKLIASETRCTYTGERLTKTKINEWPRNNQLQNYHHIILRDYHISKLPEKLECPKLEVLFLPVTGANYLNLEIPDNFFSEMRELKVLSLHGRMLTNPPPLSLRCLAGLRSLDLTNNELEDISIIGELTSLEILILQLAQKLVMLPKKIGDLTRLRVLNLNCCQRLKFIPENLLSSLECLEELYMEKCPIKWKVEGSNSDSASLGELRNLDKLTALHLLIVDGSTLPGDLHNFENLERYDITIGGWSSEYDFNFSRVLKFFGPSISTLFTNVGFKPLLTRVERLYLLGWKYVAGDDFMKLGHLPELRCLKIWRAHAGTAPVTLFVKKVSNMPNLETLELSGMETCKIWEDNLDAHSHVRNLRTLNIAECSRLTSLFPSSVARALAELKHLEIDDCKKLKAIFVQEDISIEEAILPNLETLTISRLDELESLWPNHLAPNSYCKLNKMEVSGCHKLLNVFPSYVLNSLYNLETLEVSGCDELQVLFEIPEPSTIATNKQGLSTRLRTLTLGSLPELKHICSKDPHGILRFQNLCMVEVNSCESLDYGFPFSVAENLQQLQVLNIYGWGIENIFEKNDCYEVKLFSLEKLKLGCCAGLKNMVVPPSVVFQNLNDLNVFGCDGAVNVMSPTTARSLSKLRVLSIAHCRSIEEIVASENDGDAPSDITFMTLETLELQRLPRLESFCRGNYSFNFPSLKEVIVRKCGMMETFCNGNLTSPFLTSVNVRSPILWYPKVDRWDGDLNATIRSIFSEKISKQGSSPSSLESEDEGSCSNARSLRSSSSQVSEQGSGR